MRRSLAAASVALVALAGPASADPVRFLHRTVKDTLDGLDECMDCVPPLCQILNSCAKP